MHFSGNVGVSMIPSESSAATAVWLNETIKLFVAPVFAMQTDAGPKGVAEPPTVTAADVVVAVPVLCQERGDAAIANVGNKRIAAASRLIRCHFILYTHRL